MYMYKTFTMATMYTVLPGYYLHSCWLQWPIFYWKAWLDIQHPVLSLHEWDPVYLYKNYYEQLLTNMEIRSPPFTWNTKILPQLGSFSSGRTRAVPTTKTCRPSLPEISSASSDDIRLHVHMLNTCSCGHSW